MTVAGARASFARAFGREATVVASAPGRVNLIGEHTDYNGGDVLPIATESRTYVAMGPSRAATSRAVSATHGPPGAFGLRLTERSGAWWDYVAGPLSQLVSLGLGVTEVDVAVVSAVPAGSGLSSSAALGVATALAAARLGRAEAELASLARAAHRAECDFVGVPCGIMDQFASALARRGHALHVKCDTEQTENVAFGGAVLIFDTALQRALRDSAYDDRRAECARALQAIRARFPEVRSLARASPEQARSANLASPLRERAQHVIEENARVQRAVAALKATGHLPGDLLVASHHSLRTLFQCSAPELDWFVAEAAGREGVTGARLTGAGWGGCAIAVGATDALHELGSHVEPAYRAHFGRDPRWWITEAGAGATLDWRTDD